MAARANKYYPDEAMTMMEADAQFDELFRAFRRRISLLLGVRRAGWGMAAAGALALALVLVDHLTAWYITPEMLLGLLVLGGIAGYLSSRIAPPSDLAVALTLEHRLRVKERVSSAIALNGEDAQSLALRALITADAARHLAGASPRALFPLTLARPHRLAVGVWAGVCLLFVLPSIPWFQSPEVREERIAMREAGKALREQAEELRKRSDVTEDEIARQVAHNMRKLGIELENHRIPKKEALVQLHKLEEEALKAEESLDRTQAARDRQGMKEAADAMKQALEQRGKAEKAAAERAREQLANGKSREALTPEESKALQREERLSALRESLERGDQAAANEALRQVGEMLDSRQLSDTERRQLAETLEQLSHALSETSAQEMARAAQEAADALKDKSAPQQRAAEALREMPQPGQSNTAEMRNAMRQAQGQLSTTRARLAQGGKPCANCGSRACNGQCRSGGQRPGGENGLQPGGNKPGGGTPGGGTSGGSTPGTNPSDGEGPGAGHLSDRQEARMNAGTEAVRQRTQLDEARTAYSVDIRGEPGKANRTNIPYYEVYPDYRRSAEQAIDSEEVPPAERARVKAYFEALDPSRQ